MANSRTIVISIDHLVSEVVAFPFFSHTGLEQRVVRLDPELRGATAPLWRAAERYFTARFPHTSIDELISIRNVVWFGDEAGAASPGWSLREYLESIARQYLASNGAWAVPSLPPAMHGRGGIASYEAPDPSARRAWRWLSFALPTDLILAGLRQGKSGPCRVEVVSPGVASLLQAGFAETHLHFGIAFDFAQGWAAAVHFAGRPAGPQGGMTWNAFQSPGAADDEGAFLASWLVRAAITRYLLASYLRWGRQRQPHLRGYLDEDLPGRLTDLQFPPRDLATLRSALRDLVNGRLDELSRRRASCRGEFPRYQQVYRRLTRLMQREYPETLDEVQALDPLADFYAVHPHPGPSVQLQFLWESLEYLETHPADVDFARLFWQAERVRCQVYRHCIQRPLTPGLTNFVRFYERKGAICRPLDGITLESAGVLGGVGRGLASLEVRTSPKSNRDRQRSEISALRDQYQQLRQRSTGSAWSATECGLVLHFLKFRGTGADQGRPQAWDAGDFADPGCRKNRRGYRWEQFFIDRRREARAIGNALALDPTLLQFLRGIDVCRDEPGVPSWVVAPLFALVRSRVNEIRARHRERTGVELPPLRTTAHVGEDFVHLASGVRCMDEALRFLPLGAGDRVGHGLALGVDPLEWARRATRLAMSREMRWLDLVWERHWHADPDARFSNARRVFVEDEIVRLAHRMFVPGPGDPSWTAQRAVEFVCALHDFGTLQALGFPDRSLPAESPPGIRGDLTRYLTDRQVYRNCRVVEWVEAARDGEAVAELQRLVRRRFADLGLSIEVNPISNLLVGDLSDLESHPLWRLAPGLGHDLGSALRMCVGSDDPFPFATTLPEEYQFLFDSLVLAGKSQAEAREWLNNIRQIGMESRFTLPVNR